MYNCIFSGHCMEPRCDKSCPAFVQTTYLLERNDIPINSSVFRTEPSQVNKTLKILEDAQGSFRTVIDASDTASRANLLTYCAICQNWKGSQLHCVVYHLKYSRYLDELQSSWSSRESESLGYTKIWIKTAKVLIISGIDFVNFKNFQCQTLLELIQQRSSNPDNTTILVSPKTSSLVGDGGFFGQLLDRINKAVI